MQISIDTESPEPLFAQLIAQIKNSVQSGGLEPGSALPSIRQLANDLGLNNKTVAKAYQLLERDGVIQTRGYRGTVVHPDAVANSQVDLSAWVQSKIDKAVAECKKAGATDTEVRIAFTNAMRGRSKEGE